MDPRFEVLTEPEAERLYARGIRPVAAGEAGRPAGRSAALGFAAAPVRRHRLGATGRWSGFDARAWTLLELARLPGAAGAATPFDRREEKIAALIVDRLHEFARN